MPLLKQHVDVREGTVDVIFEIDQVVINTHEVRHDSADDE
jgi:hypothetical protein